MGKPLSGENGRLTVEQIIAATGCPEANVRKYWPEIRAALEAEGIGQLLVQIGAAATVATEVWSFRPVKERADGSAYEGRSDLGNTVAGDGVRYKGRGFIQLTGRANYREYGQRIGVDLESSPDSALEPSNAAKLLGCYFRDHAINKACEAYDWREVRKLVNGGYNGWERFISVVRKLLVENGLA